MHASENLLDYLQRLVAYTRQSAEFEVGLSPRGALALLDCAKTWAVMHNREHVVPEDVQLVLPAVAGHRLIPSGIMLATATRWWIWCSAMWMLLGPEKTI